MHVDEEFKFSTLGQHKLTTSTAWRNQRNEACRGLGVLLSKKATEASEEVASVTKRILTCHFGGNPATTVIMHCAYAPLEGSDVSEKHITYRKYYQNNPCSQPLACNRRLQRTHRN